MIINQNERRKIISFGGGKGGTGKSLLASNIAILLASQGRKVILVDLDLGASNAHTYLDIKNQYIGIANWQTSGQIAFEELIQETPYTNLYFISGDVLVPGAANYLESERLTIIEQIQKLSYDYILLDLPSGGPPHALGYFMISNSGIMVIEPELPSILNSFNFIKSSIYQRIEEIIANNNHQELLNHLHSILGEESPNSTPLLAGILEEIDKIESTVASQIRDELSSLTPFILLNKVCTPNELGSAQKLRALIRKNLAIECECLGGVYFELALYNQREEAPPLALRDSELGIINQLERICQKILLSPDFPIMPLDLEHYKDSFELADIELQGDYQAYQAMGEGDFSLLEKEELLATIQSQKEQLEQLESHTSSDALITPETAQMASHINNQGRISNSPPTAERPGTASPQPATKAPPPSSAKPQSNANVTNTNVTKKSSPTPSDNARK